MQIKGFIENSLLEWEGWISSVLFLPGCNLRCRYCHAAHLIIRPNQLESVPLEQVMACWNRQRGWIDGVVISGGEPTLHGDELVQLIRRIRTIPQKVLVQTNGTRPDWIETVLSQGLLDAIAMDLKAPLTSEDYRRVVQRDVDTERVRASIRLIMESGIPHEFRITVVPTLIGEDELRRMAPALEGAQKVAIQNFKPDLCLSKKLRSISPYMPEELDKFGEILSSCAKRCIIQGRERGLVAGGKR